MNKTNTFNFSYAVLGFILISVFQYLYAAKDIEVIPYSEFQSLLADKQIANVVVTENRLEGQFLTAQNGKTGFVTNRVDPTIVAEFDKAGVTY